jgi:anthranilate synthase/aminodeoxychorismate synthase-like glutamine amidotransferase
MSFWHAVVIPYFFIHFIRKSGGNTMYVMIDNFDSFVYNLKAYFEELGREILVKRCDEITLEELEELKPEGIILSPGPKRPWDAALCVETVNRFQGRVPILGVCLGHQVLGHCAGAVVEKGKRPMHGKVTEICNYGTGVFAGLPEEFKVTRYHSLIVRGESLPEEYQVDAVSKDGAVMGISHKILPLYGVQFHPEAVLTEYGHELLENFCKIAERFQQEQERVAIEKTA